MGGRNVHLMRSTLWSSRCNGSRFSCCSLFRELRVEMIQCVYSLQSRLKIVAGLLGRVFTPVYTRAARHIPDYSRWLHTRTQTRCVLALIATVVGVSVTRTHACGCRGSCVLDSGQWRGANCTMASL